MNSMMHTANNTELLIAFILYLLAVISVALFAYFKTRNLSDYILGGRRLGGAVAALSAGASDMSSWLLMGLPGIVYTSGLRQVWVSIGLLLGAYGCWKLIARRLRIYSEVANDSVTLPAYLDNRFRDTSKMIRMIAAFATLIFFTFYIASGLYAGGLLLGTTFGLSYTEGLWLGAFVIMLYTSIGGFLAVSWTDFFQGTLMLICLLLVPFFAVKQMGGWDSVLSKVVQHNVSYLEFTQGVTLTQLISLMAWGLGYFGMPHILVRFMAVRTVKEIPLARTVCIWWMSLSLLGAVLVGIVGAAQFFDNPLNNPETVFMQLSDMVFMPWVTGIILAAILSSSMCAIDSQMLAASSALTEDFYHALFRRHASQKELMWVGRGTCVFIAGAGIYIARQPSQSIMDLVQFAWGGLASTFAASVVLSLYWKRTTRNGIVVGMILGGGTAILWRFLGLTPMMNEILPGILASLIGVSVVSLLGKHPESDVLHEFERVQELVHFEALEKIPKAAESHF